MSNGRRMAGRICELGQERGEIDPRLKTEQLALQLQQSFIGTMLLWSLRGEQKLQTAVEASFLHFWRAMCQELRARAMRKNLDSLLHSDPCYRDSLCMALRSKRRSYRLTLRDAIEKGLQANLSVLVANTRVEEAEGTRTRRLSAALLPRVRSQSYAKFQNRNLRAFGISAPGFPRSSALFRTTTSALLPIRTFSTCRVIAATKRVRMRSQASKLDYQDARDLDHPLDCRPLPRCAIGRGSRRCRPDSGE